MRTHDLLQAVASSTGGGLEGDQLRLTRRGVGILLAAITDDLWMTAIEAAPVQRLLLTLETGVTQALERLEIPHELTLGIPALDARYVIKGADPDASRALLQDPETLRRIHALEPFTELELGYRSYRLVRALPTSGWTPEQLLASLDPLLDLVEQTRAR